MWQAFLGPQVYYRVPLTKGSWYRLALKPQFPGALYVSRASAGCTGTDIDTDCGSITGTVVPKIPAGGLGATAFSPSFSGDYLVAVDSLTTSAAGAFSLTIESYTPAGNMLCGGAKALKLSSTGALTLSDTTAGALNDLGAHVKCGTSTALVAPQRYYTVPLEQRSYELLLKPAFTAALAVGQSCLLLPNDCGSGGLTGTELQVAGGQIGSKVFAAPKAGTYVLALDSTESQAAGAFVLQIKEYAAPTHGACATPRSLEPTTSPLVELDDTSPLKNDLPGINCGGASSWPGPQAYFRVALAGGTSYTVKLRPEPGFDPALYAFPAATSCATKAVNAACAGHASDVVGAGKPEDIALAPKSDGDWILVVDAWSASEVGKFALSVSW
jgi:hypothetical protein